MLTQSLGQNFIKRVGRYTNKTKKTIILLQLIQKAIELFAAEAED